MRREKYKQALRIHRLKKAVAWNFKYRSWVNVSLIFNNIYAVSALYEPRDNPISWFYEFAF